MALFPAIILTLVPRCGNGAPQSVSIFFTLIKGRRENYEVKYIPRVKMISIASYGEGRSASSELRCSAPGGLGRIR